MPENDPDDFKGLPLDPSPEQLLSAYRLCRLKLVRANRSWNALSGHDTYRGSLIVDLKDELDQLEDALHGEATERAKLHELNGRILKIIQDYESGLGEAISIVEESDKGGLSVWVVRFARLLPVVLRLRDVKANARSLLGRLGIPQLLPPEPLPQLLPEPQGDSAPQPESIEEISVGETVQDVPQELFPPPPPLVTPPIGPGSQPQTEAPSINRSAYGPLLLKYMDGDYGVLLLDDGAKPPREDLVVDADNPWLPGHPLLVPRDPEDLGYAAIEAGFLAIEQEPALLPELQPWMERGVLPFVLDPLLQLPRLVHDGSLGSVSHVLVREAKASVFQEQISRVGFDLDSNHWLGFQLTPDEAVEFWSWLELVPGRSRREQGPRLSTRGGVSMVDRQGFLATGLGLPFLAAPLDLEIKQVQLKLADGLVLTYVRPSQADDAADRKIWQPSPEDRRRVALPEGPARFTTTAADGSSLHRTIELTALPERVRFHRLDPLAYREDWDLSLGPLELPDPAPGTLRPSPSALQWARQRLNQGDANVNALFEQQMLESLSALFQRRSSLQRRDFQRLYAQLRNKPDEWPGFPEAVLRGWCEGGWLEEGVEQRSGRWRVHPVDPRLVRLGGGGLQLVGLLSARGLVAVLATARELGLQIRTVPPSCPDMPRGWRFYGPVDDLGRASGLPVVETSDWIPDPRGHAWILERPSRSDSPPWPIGQESDRRADAVCGRRGEHHFKPAKPLPEGHRASIHLKFEAETSRHGKRRWHSHDNDRDSVFISCHRNRVALHALVVATNGLWPFGFTRSDIGQIDRLYDAEAYLPLPLARWAALTGRAMPGPTRHRPSDHTYRYHVSASLRSHQLRSDFLPLTRTP